MSLIEVNQKLNDYLTSMGRLPPWSTKTTGCKFYDERIAAMAGRLEDFADDAETVFFQKLSERFDDRQKLEDALVEAFDGREDEIGAFLRDEAETVAQGTRVNVVRQLQELGVDQQFHEISDDVMTDVQDNVEKFSIQAFKDKKDTVRSKVLDGIRAGEREEKIRNRLRDEFQQMRDYKMERVARTEVGFAHNKIRDQSHRDFDVKYKMWITAQDASVRTEPGYDHTMMHGQVVKVDEPFVHPQQGWQLMYPQERSGALGNIINCRCTTRAYIPTSPEQITSTPFYPNEQTAMFSRQNTTVFVSQKDEDCTFSMSPDPTPEYDLTNSTRITREMKNIDHRQTYARFKKQIDSTKFTVTQENWQRFADKVSEYMEKEGFSYGINTNASKIANRFREWNARRIKDNPIGAMLSFSAKKHFDIENAFTRHIRNFRDNARVVFNDDVAQGVMGKILTDMKDDAADFISQTKETAEKGITVFRGMSWDREDIKEGVTTITSAPLESWTTELKMAKNFAVAANPRKVPVVFATTVDTDDIVSTGATGLGTTNEKEIIVKGGMRSAFVKIKDSGNEMLDIVREVTGQ